MSKNWFEQNLNKKLSGSAEDFDLDANWKAIQAKRSKKKRRVLYLWFVLPSMLILLAGGSFYLTGRSGNLKGQPTTSPAQNPIALSNVKEDRNAETSEYLTSNNIGNNSNLSKSINPKASKKSEEKTSQNHKKLHNQSDESYHLGQSINNSTIRTYNAPGKDEIKPEIAADVNYTSKETATIESNEVQTILLLDSKLQLLPEADIELETPIFNLSKRNKNVERKNSSYWIGASTMFGLQSVKRSGPENLYASRQNEEGALDLIQAGFEFGLKLNKHISLQTGLSFTQFTDKRIYENTEIYSVIDSNFIISKLLKADGSMQDIYGVAEIPYLREINETSYNRYRHMELPVILAWENKLTSNFSFRAGAGVSLGLISSRSGSISDHLNAQIPLTQASYKSQGQLAALIRIEWMYTKPGWSAGIIIQGRSDLLNQLRSNAGYTERRSAQTFGLAYRIHL